MQQLSENQGYHVISSCLRYVQLRSAGLPALAAFKDTLGGYRTQLTTDWNAYQDVQEQRIALSGEVGYLDSEVDNLVITIGQLLLLQVGRDRKAPAYRRLFPESPSSLVVELAGPRQEKNVSVLIETIKTDEAYAPLRDKAAGLETAMTALKQAVARRADLYAQEASARAKYLMTADAARRAYNSLYHQFMLAMPDQKRLVESLFYPLNRAGAPDPAAPGSDTPAEG